MDIRRQKLTVVSFSLAFLFAVASPIALQAKEGLAKLRVIVRPVETDVFIDGQHMGDATYDGTLQVPDISPGEHTVELRNWGYTPQIYKLNFTAGKATYLEARLEPLQGEVSGPLGQIEVRHDHRADILLNGKTPEYSVGHVGLSHGRFHSTLLAPPGTYELAVVHGDKTYWDGQITVQEGKKTVVDAGTGKTLVAQAGPMPDPPYFRGHLLRSQVVVGPVNAAFSAAPGTINCGESSQLTWNSTGAVHNEINGMGEVQATGQQSVNPTATTTYTMTAKGPGGTATPTTTVTVNNAVDASLTVSPADVTYPGNATVSWNVTSPGTTTVSIDPLGTVGMSGSQQVTIPDNMSTGGDVTYTLHATNNCGGEATRTATLHVAAAPAPAAAPQPMPQAAEAPKELPKTASDMPLVGLIGLASIGAALALHEAVKRMS